ncbi:hypothetical protein ACKLNO_09665 [Neisseriaceae bacterium B1]
MKTEITLKYPRCQEPNIKKNGFQEQSQKAYFRPPESHNIAFKQPLKFNQ